MNEKNFNENRDGCDLNSYSIVRQSLGRKYDLIFGLHLDLASLRFMDFRTLRETLFFSIDWCIHITKIPIQSVTGRLHVSPVTDLSDAYPINHMSVISFLVSAPRSMGYLVEGNTWFNENLSRFFTHALEDVNFRCNSLH